MSHPITAPITSESLLPLLARWHAAARRRMHPVPGRSDWLFYGSGNQTSWAVQAHCTATAALAVLGGDGGMKAAGDEAIRMFRYLLATHRSGGDVTTSGKPWGHHWISVLGMERLAHALPALEPWMTEADRKGWNRLLLSESEFLLEGYKTVGAIDAATGRNKPESNLWNASVLYRCAALFPEVPNARRFREKAIALMLNGISTPADATSEAVFSGRPLREWHVGPNFTESLGLHHHGYLNVGYMVICLSQIAMFLLACRDENIPAPPEMLHHARELWQLVKSLTFPDGRLWRIGGDTRVRYCYCQDYAVPVWLLVRDLWNDREADAFLANWFSLVATEQGDGGEFLSRRLSELETISPLYYSRLEGDRAVSVAMAIRWVRSGGLPAPREPGSAIAPLKTWHDAFHGAVMVRGERRWASWTSEGAVSPVGTLALPGASDLVEWGTNLAGSVRGAGCTFTARRLSETMDRFPGGFLVAARYRWEGANDPAEGSETETVAEGQTVYAALPDDATVIILQRAVKTGAGYVREIAGLNLSIPNDIYNNHIRSYSIHGQEHRLAGAGECALEETIPCGDRLGIDGKLELHALYGGGLQLRRPGKRTVNLSKHALLQFGGAGAHLYCDRMAIPFDNRQRFEQAGTLLFDIGVLGAVGGVSPEGCAVSDSTAAVKIVEARGADGQRYRLLANFSPEACDIPPCPGGAKRLGGTESTTLLPGEAVLYHLP